MIKPCIRLENLKWWLTIIRPSKTTVNGFHPVFRYGVDKFDETVGRLAFLPATRRWPVRIFMWMIFAAACNSYVLCQERSSRRAYINKLAFSLMDAQKRRRAAASNWFLKTFLQIENMLDNLKTKIMGGDKASVLHCYICNKVFFKFWV